VSHAQVFTQIASLPDELIENSGLAYYGNGILYFINDGGNPVSIYHYDTATQQLTERPVGNASNQDWEDLAQDGDGNLYIGDFGNNNNSRQNLRIYKLPNPEENADTLQPDTISFSYENQTAFPPTSDNLNFDCEAMVWYNDSLYLFSKNRTNPFTGWTYLYVLPAEPGNYTAMLRDSLKVEGTTKEQGWITGADIKTENGKAYVCLLGSGSVLRAGGFLEKPLDDLTWKRDQIAFSQKEAIVFGDARNEMFISDEFFVIGNNLYTLISDIPVGRQVFKEDDDVIILLRPDGFTIETTFTKRSKVCLYSLDGKKLKVFHFKNRLELGLNNFVPGTYVLYVEIGKKTYRLKWIKTE
jgi:hypothetical protein